MIQYLEFNDLVSSDKYRNRYYDAHSGRFLQEDPHPGLNREPSSFNSKYAYVMNDPLNFSDPEGAIRISFNDISRIVSDSVNDSFNLLSKGMGEVGIHVSSEDLMRSVLIAGAIVGGVVAVSSGNPHLGAASVAIGYRNLRDWGKKGTASSVLFTSVKIGGAAVIGAEVGVLIGGIVGAMAVPLVTSFAGRQIGLSKKEANEAGMAAGVGCLGGMWKGGISSGGGKGYNWSGGRLTPL